MPAWTPEGTPEGVADARRSLRCGRALRLLGRAVARPFGHAQFPLGLCRRAAAGFTLIEVLVALGIVAVALAAGARATSALTENASRQRDALLAQLCAQNTLVQLRLSRQLPDVGDSTQSCEQARRRFTVRLSVRGTPNPSFRRVDARVSEGDTPLLSLSTVVGRY